MTRAGLIVLGAAIASFGLYNIHQQSGITEGGVLGTVLLLHHWLGWPASVITPILDLSCYALALSIAKATHIRISQAYLFTDLTVLLLSLTYIPFRRIAYSLITVTISSWLIDLFQMKKQKPIDKIGF